MGAGRCQRGGPLYMSVAPGSTMHNRQGAHAGVYWGLWERPKPQFIAG